MYMDGPSGEALNQLSAQLGIAPGILGLLFIVVAIWTLVWKGFGLWHAARDTQKWWFLAFIIINDLGILEMLYIFWIRKQRANETPSLFEEPPVVSVQESTN